MYKKSIKNNSKFIIPFIQGIKLYGKDDILSNVGTMIIVNENGTLLTCKHIADEIINANISQENYPKLLNKINNLNNKEKEEFEKNNNLTEETCILSIINWMLDIKNETKIEIISHPLLDLAIIKLNGIKLKKENYPIFSTKLPVQGQSVCKLGYAFPNIDIFEYNKEIENIIIKENSNLELPLFPIDGIVTRHINLNINNKQYNNVMFETSTPGLRGQSGGPIFSPEGLIYGIQSMTSHIDLEFDINKEVKRGNITKTISSTPFMNLGIGISSTEIIKFLEDNKIDFNKR